MDVLLDGIVFGESPRWQDGRLWFSDWGAGRVFSVAADAACGEPVLRLGSGTSSQSGPAGCCGTDTRHVATLCGADINAMGNQPRT